MPSSTLSAAKIVVVPLRFAVLASLIETAKLNGIDPQAYVADVLARLVAGDPANRITDLLPWAWAAERERPEVAA